MVNAGDNQTRDPSYPRDVTDDEEAFVGAYRSISDFDERRVQRFALDPLPPSHGDARQGRRCEHKEVLVSEAQ